MEGGLVLILKKLKEFLTVFYFTDSTLGGCGGLERTDFWEQFLHCECVVFM